MLNFQKKREKFVKKPGKVQKINFEKEMWKEIIFLDRRKVAKDWINTTYQKKYLRAPDQHFITRLSSLKQKNVLNSHATRWKLLKQKNTIELLHN